MERDDAGAFARLREIRERLIDPKIAEHGGRVVKTAGDGMLLEFGSADAALRCAIAVQRAMSADNEWKSLNERIDFRIGINLGDIIVDGNDIAGDGVNVAARLEALAEPGGICVSAAVRDQVHGSLDVRFDDIGDQQVKNIMRPIRVFAVALGVADAHGSVTRHVARMPSQTGMGASTTQPRLARTKSAAFIAAVSVIGLAVAGLSFQWWNSRSGTPKSPPAFSVAVIPFNAPGGTPADQQFAELVAQRITTTLGGTERYAKIVSEQVPTGDRKPVDARAIGRERNVRYVLEGDVQSDVNKASITTRLLDAESATQLWNHQFDGARSQWTAGSGEVPWSLISGLRGALWRAEEQRVAHAPRTSESAWDLVLRAQILERNRSLTGTLEARKLIDEALRLDPVFVDALIERAYIDGFLWEMDPSPNRVELAQDMDQFARRALAIDRTYPEAWRARTYALMLQWRWDAALEAAAEASRLEPGAVVRNAGDRGWLLAMTGHADEASMLFDKAIVLDPRSAMDPNFRHNQCYVHLLLGQFDNAVEPCEKSVAAGDDWWPHLFLTVAYAQTGDMAKAAASKTELLRRRPTFSIAQFIAMGLSDNPVFLKQNEMNFVTGLRKAEIPEK